jgi:hypothetical protein
MSFFMVCLAECPPLAGNVLQAKVGGLSKHQLTLPTKGILKILTLLVSRKKKLSTALIARER